VVGRHAGALRSGGLDGFAQRIRLRAVPSQDERDGAVGLRERQREMLTVDPRVAEVARRDGCAGHDSAQGWVVSSEHGRLTLLGAVVFAVDRLLGHPESLGDVLP